ncbi:glycerol-3-phosphate 1-O-acyltransferase PlsY [Lachnospiraceae bacterium 62-35]
MQRIFCLVLGYLFGLFQTGYIYGKIKHIDLRKYGSGNSGTTNALRVLGWKAGLVVFIGDFMKTIIPCIIVRFLPGSRDDMVYLLILYTAFGVILGHNFPFYMGFKGGKGIAATAGLLVAFDWRITLICLVIFVVTVGITRYVSLGSILVVSAFLIGTIYWGKKGDFGLAPEYLYEFYGIAAVITAMAVWRHRANIGRLLHGTENKLGAKKKEA